MDASTSDYVMYSTNAGAVRTVLNLYVGKYYTEYYVKPTKRVVNDK
jgi:Na+/H+-translocating membrane pyrophosphatase